MTTIAFIGVGNMGGPMARNLLKAGDGVRAFDLSAGGAQAGHRRGRAKVRQTALEAVQDADVVITMLPAGSMCARSIWRTRAC